MKSKLSELTNREIDDLVRIGHDIVRPASIASSNLSIEKQADSISWVSRTGRLLEQLYAPETQLRKMYNHVVESSDFSNMHSNSYQHGTQIQGILQSVKHELSIGLIADFAGLIEAAVFADFLEMAEYLLTEGYKDAAAVMIGGVLEDSLRKISDKNKIATHRSDGKPMTMEPLNINLAKASVYDKLVQKQITSWASLRNDAAHGNYSKYDESQVRMMLLFVQDFINKFIR